MKKLFIHRPLFRILMPPVYGTLVYLLILLINNSILYLSESFFSQEVYLSIAMTYLVMEVNHLGIVLSDKYLSSMTLRSKVIVQILINSVITLLIVAFAIHSYFTYVLGFSSYVTELTYFSVIFLVTSWMYCMINFSHLYLNMQNQERLEEENQLRQLVEKEFQAYQYDINPNLLFESLESLISLVHRDPVAAEDFIDRLSLAYRYILSNKQNELVNLWEELQASENLICLLNVRYNDNIQFGYHLSKEDEGRKIIPGTITSIIELIIRKSIINGKQPLSINCSLELDGYLAVQYKSNDRLVPGYENEKILDRLHKTYSFFSDKPIVTVEAYGESYIKVPALEMVPEEIAI